MSVSGSAAIAARRPAVVADDVTINGGVDAGDGVASSVLSMMVIFLPVRVRRPSLSPTTTCSSESTISIDGGGELPTGSTVVVCGAWGSGPEALMPSSCTTSVVW